MDKNAFECVSFSIFKIMTYGIMVLNYGLTFSVFFFYKNENTEEEQNFLFYF